MGRPVIDFLTSTAADDQTAGFQLLQVVGQGRAAHIHHDRQIDNTFFAVTQNPKKSKSAAVSQKSEQFCNGAKILIVRQVGEYGRGAFVVIVGQGSVGHIHSSFCTIIALEFGRCNKLFQIDEDLFQKEMIFQERLTCGNILL